MMGCASMMHACRFKTIELLASEIEGLSPEAYEVIGQKVSYRLAQHPGSSVVLKYVRPVIKRCDTEAIDWAPPERCSMLAMTTGGPPGLASGAEHSRDSEAAPIA